MATLMEDILFELPELGDQRIVISGDVVKGRLSSILGDDDLRRYIL
jgi:ATP-dependent HslUV protease ATP-binding subunit HslU